MFLATQYPSYSGLAIMIESTISAHGALADASMACSIWLDQSFS